MKKVVIKVSGELLDSTDNLKQVVTQIKELSKEYKIGIVVGAGNIFRGKQHGKALGLNATTGDSAGMLATIINGLILKDMLSTVDVSSKILTAFSCPRIADEISQEKINCSFKKDKVVIFVGGTGNPFFTTDTNAVLRALQIGSEIVLKGTKVDGIFDSDPKTNNNAKLIKNISYNDILKNKLQVMDLTAITLAENNNVKIKVFNIFKKNAIIKAIKEIDFGSTIN